MKDTKEIDAVQYNPAANGLTQSARSNTTSGTFEQVAIQRTGLSATRLQRCMR